MSKTEFTLSNFVACTKRVRKIPARALALLDRITCPAKSVSGIYNDAALTELYSLGLITFSDGFINVTENGMMVNKIDYKDTKSLRPVKAKAYPFAPPAECLGITPIDFWDKNIDISTVVKGKSKYDRRHTDFRGYEDDLVHLDILEAVCNKE
ncbi:MAG: hypothetical protein ACRDDY_16960 [Clostridium sp.]|uniref:hypothetical protein n=1 Tax=Clostridium sp. TaxID=1506 RepID=UPI003EE711EB